MNFAKAQIEATVYAAAYAAVLGTSIAGTSMLKIDAEATRQKARDEARRAVQAFREFAEAS